ncbi:MAG: hypothetical protein VB859_19270 [Planctomycetaceae bacterium]
MQFALFDVEPVRAHDLNAIGLVEFFLRGPPASSFGLLFASLSGLFVLPLFFGLEGILLLQPRVRRLFSELVFQFRNSVAPGLQFLPSVLQLLTQLHDKRDQLIPIEFHLRLPVHAGVLPNSRICARPCFAEWTSYGR